MGSGDERLLKLEEKSLREEMPLTPAQIARVEKANRCYRERHVESNCPGGLIFYFPQNPCVQDLCPKELVMAGLNPMQKAIKRQPEIGCPGFAHQALFLFGLVGNCIDGRVDGIRIAQVITCDAAHIRIQLIHQRYPRGDVERGDRFI